MIFALLIQAVLAYLPYIFYYAACQSIVQPLVNDAKEIAKIAEKSPESLGDFDYSNAKDRTEVSRYFYDKWNNIPHYTQTEKYGKGLVSLH